MDDRTRIEEAIVVLRSRIACQDAILASIRNEILHATSDVHRQEWERAGHNERRIRDAYVASLKLLTGE